ncbi:MAG: STAS domain-containing protein [Alphaproteobacteria bacterium]|nr:STAS domain-containing protein [Alphaproteobacteria bacterium]
MQVEFTNQTTDRQFVSLQGALNFEAMETIRQIFDVMVLDARKEVVLDLTHVHRLDSSGVGALVFLFKRLKAEGRKMVIHGVHGQPEAIIRLLRLEQAIDTEFLN